MATPGVSERLISLGPWPTGANNLALETSVPRRSFRRGINVDVTDDGKVVRRDGATLAFEGDDLHSLFGYGRRGFFVEAGTLFGFEVIDGTETEPLALYEGLAPHVRLAHCMIEPYIFVSDGTTNLRIDADNNVAPWAVPTAPDPGAQVLPTGGTLQAGRYHVAVAYKNGSGEEGPLSGTRTVDLAEGQALAVSLTHTHAGLRSAVYMTKANGTELLHLATVPHGTPAVNVFSPRLGRPSPTLNLDPMPPARFAALWNGRLLTAADRFVQWSEPNHYSLTHLAYDYLELAQPITGLAAGESATGFFVGQEDRTYFVSGADPADAALVVAYPAGMVPGTVTMIPGARLPLENPPVTPVPMWLASNGVFCVGMQDGTVFPLTETRYAARTGQEGAALFMQKAGRSKFVTTVRDPQENTFAMSDQFTAEVVRNGIP